MEALQELEKVQRVLFLMGSCGLSDSVGSGGGGDRFLLFLVQLFDSLSMEKKVLLLSELLKKVNVDTLEEVQHIASLEGTTSERLCPSTAHQDISSGALLQPNKKSKMHAEKLTTPDVPMIGFDAMTRANSTLEDFLDASNEHSLRQVPDNSASSTVLERNKEAFNETSFSDVLDPLLDLFRCQGLMTNQLRKELKSGIEYWSLERKLC